MEVKKKMSSRSKVLLFSCVAGLCASGAAIFAKLSSAMPHFYLSVSCIGMMVLMNAIMWLFFSKALSASATSIVPTVVSAGINYLFSGLMGVFVFKETTSLTWWFGLGSVMMGLMFISKGAGKG